MRTIVDLPEDDVRALDLIGKKEDVSRAELVRRAVTDYLEKEQETAKNDLDKYFGMFKDDPTVWNGIDGLSYQKMIRKDWEDRDAAIDTRLAEARYGLHDHGQEPYASPEKPPQKDTE